jgi:hypothetical protein
MRVTLGLLLLTLLLPVYLPAQTSATDWIEALGDPAVGSVVSRIEEEEANLPPLSPLSQRWLEAVEELGARLLLSGVHRSEARYQEVTAYLYERARWAGVPAQRIARFRRQSETLLATVADGPDELVVTAELLGTQSGSVERGEASESGALDALRRAEMELLTASSLSEKARAAERIAAATELVVEMEESLSFADAPAWSSLAVLLRETRRVVEELRRPGGEPTLPLTEMEPELGVPEEAILGALGGGSPALIEMALRWDPQIALGAATFFDRYRWSLAPLGGRAQLGAQLFVIEERQRELYLELFRRRAAERRESVALSRQETASEQLREQLLREGKSVLSRFEERSHRGDEEGERWALLSVLSHPLAQTLLFREGEVRLRETLRRKVDSLYDEVDTRARELIGLVARRHAVADWEYLVTPVPDSFDRIVTVEYLPNEGLESRPELIEQLSDAYFRAFNLTTNPEQNLDARGRRVAKWSMLHGQYFETREVRRPGRDAGLEEGRFRQELEAWFLAADEEEEPRAAFPFAYRGYQRIHHEQRAWLSSAGERLPRRMAPIPPADLLLAAEVAGAFLAGDASLHATENLLGYLLEADILPAHFAWAEALSETRRRYERVSSSETTAALLTLLSEQGELTEGYPALRAVMEGRLRRILLLQELGLLDPSIPLATLYDTWSETALDLLLREDRIADALALPERWQEEGLLPPEAAERFYRALSVEGTRLLGSGEVEDE